MFSRCFFGRFFEEAQGVWIVCLCRRCWWWFCAWRLQGKLFPNAFTREDDFDDDDAENWEDCLLHTRGVLDDDIDKTIVAEDFANMVTRICGFDDSSEERKKCVWLFFLCCHLRIVKRLKILRDIEKRTDHGFDGYVNTSMNSRGFHPHIRRVGDVRA